MQMVERPWGVAAYGAASVKAMPDLVRARFKVIRVEQTPSQAFAAASDAVHAVRQTLRRHEVSDAAVERSRVGRRLPPDVRDQIFGMLVDYSDIQQ